MTTNFSWKAPASHTIRPKLQRPTKLTTPSCRKTGSGDTCNTHRGRASNLTHYRLMGATQHIGNRTCAEAGCVGKLTISEPIVINNDCCEVEKNHLKRVRSGGMQIKKNYCVSSQEYLRRRCKTYDQNTFNYQKSPEDTANNTFLANCSAENENCKIVTQKKSNGRFATQGAVSSSARTHDIKHQEVSTGTRQNRNLNMNSSCTYRRNGKKTMCFV